MNVPAFVGPYGECGFMPGLGGPRRIAERDT